MAQVTLSFPDDTFSFSTTLDVRFDDVNIGAHLGNDSMVSLLGEARSRFLESLGLADLGDPGTIVADLVVNYRAEARLRDVLRFDVGITDPNRYGGDIAYRVVREQDDTLIALAKTGVVFYDYQQKRITDAPTAFA